MTKNAYIHIPFCVKKCNYCAFVSYNKLQRKKEYLTALKKEIEYFYKGEKLNTLYFGGGTPSVLTTDEVKEIIALFNLEDKSEVTFEVNPNKLSESYLKGLPQTKVNRLSIGVQTFNNDILKQIGRLHTPEDAKKAVQYARNAGFDNISIDLIYGLPSQGISDFENDLKIASDLNIEHFSLYGLKIEEETEFGQNPPENLPDDDIQAQMYLKAEEILSQKGFYRYEISNLAKPGFESQHNLNYWNANSYYGFGCGACGYENDIRYSNQTDLEKYISTPTQKLEKQLLSKEEKLEECIFLGFRKAEGINVKEINRKFNINLEQLKKQELEKYLKSNHLQKTPKGYRLTAEGFLLSNIVLADFLIN